MSDGNGAGVAWLRRLVSLLPTAESEGESARNGLFSYLGEVHSFALGVLFGLAAVLLGRVEIAAAFIGMLVNEGPLPSDGKLRTLAREARREPLYALGGLIAGVGLGPVVIEVVVTVGGWA